ncbi:pilus assembly protein [Yersinia sp. 2542 StPb PI]|uniref:pilus assembly protein n=1 Tax=unclassified Yersinia (in: enterobacteria) TaxID=2653513 RepID=UPI003B28069C
MMDLITKGYVVTQLKTQEFLKDNRGSIIEYVMVIALAGVFITLARPTLITLVQGAIDSARTAIAPTAG